MTNLGIKTMRPGPMIDELIVREFVKWPILDPASYQGDHVWLANQANYPFFTWRRDEGSGDSGPILWSAPRKDGVPWFPSREIGAAWCLLGIMQLRGLYVVVNTTCENDLFDIQLGDEIKCKFIEVFSPFPLGLCKLALRYNLWVQNGSIYQGSAAVVAE